MSYKSVLATARGGPEVLQVVENELREPSAGEARVRVLAVGVGRTDVNYRYGLSPFSPKVPFVPGYEMMGVVDSVGAGVARVAVGDRVAALIGHGGYTEMLNINQEHLVSVPQSLDPGEVATLVLNYTSGYQMLHRVAKAKAGDKALVVGASGGMGTALLELGRLSGLKMYGTASASKFDVLGRFGAQPIDYHSQDFVEVIRQQEPDGLDFAFDGMGGKEGDRAMAVLRRGGKLVEYPAPTGWGSTLLGAVKLALTGLRLDGKRAEFYGITAQYMRDKKLFMEDLPVLFNLLAEGKIKPLITTRLPLLEARKANELLESGQVSGNIVLLAPELL